MRKMQKVVSGMLAFAMLGTAVTGCSSASTEVSQDKTQAVGSQAAGEEGPVKMEWLVSQTTAEVDDDAEVVKRIEERFNIDLKGFYVDPNNYQENLNVKFAGGEMPDVIVVGSPAELATYIEVQLRNVKR